MEEYIAILKLATTIYNILKDSTMEDNISAIHDCVFEIKQTCNEIHDFQKNELTAKIPSLLSSICDFFNSPCLAKLAQENIYIISNQLINYDLNYRRYLEPKELNFCVCIGHWARYILFNKGGETQNLVSEIILSYNTDIDISSKLFPFVMKNEDFEVLEKISLKLYFHRFPKDIQLILLNEKKLELKNRICNNIKKIYELQ